jgi:hypothetical protein
MVRSSLIALQTKEEEAGPLRGLRQTPMILSNGSSSLRRGKKRTREKNKKKTTTERVEKGESGIDRSKQESERVTGKGRSYNL